MGLRSFVAPDGEEWRVWNVVPSLAFDQDTRAWERRGQDVLAYDGPERREAEHRDVTPFVNPQLAAGWLCFESGSAKRRLAPTPPTWETVSEEELTGLWESAEPVTQRKIHLPGFTLHRIP